MGLSTVEDLLYYFPHRYEAFSERKNILNLEVGDKTTVFGRVVEIKKNRSLKRRMSFTEVVIGDFTGTIKALWFNQPYIASMLKVGDKVALTGKVTMGKSGLYLANPTYEKIGELEGLGEGGSLLAIYSESPGVSSKWLRFAIEKVLRSINKETLEEVIPASILETYHLPSTYSSLIYIHTPQKLGDAEVARKRFSFEEIFFIQLVRLKERESFKKNHSFKIEVSKKEMADFIKIFPFELTPSQKKSIEQILEDFGKGEPMSRLLEGDVGSGKTAVAVAAAYAATKCGYQVAYMAPTEILAGQHFKSFINYFSQLRLTTKIGLLTSSEGKKYPSKVNPTEPTHISKSQLLKWVAEGDIPILIGTHSLIQKSVKFKKLALVIIDEQHRFGTRQRAKLVKDKSNTVPHLLSMTATPIPRTLALTIYSDLDLSLLEEMPSGRQKVITKIVHPDDRNSTYEFIRGKLKEGRQLFVICPRIEEPDPEKENALNTKAVKEEAKRLEKEVFQEFDIGILHGKMLPKEKEEALNDFAKNKTQILVATSVVEVGIDIPNASMIIIEGAERFGLAQLHQLRGRVIRGNHQPHCFVFTDSNSEKTHQRLHALEHAKNGFELAEYDLELRGSGDLTGTKQWGVTDIGMEALKNLKMVEAARVESQKILRADPELKKHPLIAKRLKEQEVFHFE
jgi:ATP-dependent DNA helicase RecG